MFVYCNHALESLNSLSVCIELGHRCVREKTEGREREREGGRENRGKERESETARGVRDVKGRHNRKTEREEKGARKGKRERVCVGERERTVRKLKLKARGQVSMPSFKSTLFLSDKKNLKRKGFSVTMLLNFVTQTHTHIHSFLPSLSHQGSNGD